MRSFKQYLKEDQGQFLTDRNEIMDWLESSKVGRYGSDLKDFGFESDGRVTVSSELMLLAEHIAKRDDGLLKVKFYKSHGCTVKYLKSLEGMPEVVVGQLEISNCRFTSLKGISREVRGNFRISHVGFLPDGIDAFPEVIGSKTAISSSCYLQMTRLTTLHNIHKHAKEINANVFISGYELKECFLGLLMIKGMTLNRGSAGSVHDEMAPVLTIINRHYKQDGTGDILECKEELMTEGYKTYAKL